MYALKAQTNN